MDLGLLVRLCPFPHHVAAPEPVRPCICVLPRLRQRDAIFPRIHADRSTNRQEGGASVARSAKEGIQARSVCSRQESIGRGHVVGNYLRLARKSERKRL